MKTHHCIEIGTVGEHKIRVIEAREINAGECGAGFWVEATLECAAIIISSGTKNYALDIRGREIPPDQIPET